MGYSIVLKNQLGEPTTYDNVDEIRLPTPDGEYVQFLAPLENEECSINAIEVVSNVVVAPNLAGENYTISMANEVGFYYCPMSVTIPKAPNLLPENIVTGVNIYGVVGTATTGGGGGGDTLGKLGAPTLSAPTLDMNAGDSAVYITDNPDNAGIDVTYHLYYRGQLIGTIDGNTILFTTVVAPMLQSFMFSNGLPTDYGLLSMLPAVIDVVSHATDYTDSDAVTLEAGLFTVNMEFGGVLNAMVRTDAGLLAVAMDYSYFSATGLIYQLSDLGLDVSTATEDEITAWVDNIHVYVVQAVEFLKYFDTSVSDEPNYTLVDECIDYTIDTTAGTMTITPDKVDDMVSFYITTSRWKELEAQLNG